uniref:Uncharacterized protein n=1 Tax=Anguilla anguilla TaxID=7936 RepID=A0A0E9QR12_ANGAN
MVHLGPKLTRFWFDSGVPCYSTTICSLEAYS